MLKCQAKIKSAIDNYLLAHNCAWRLKGMEGKCDYN